MDGTRHFQAVFRRYKENAGALPQTPPGRRFLPEPRHLRMTHGCISRQGSAGTKRTLGRCPRPRRGGGSSPNPATCGWCISQATLRSCQGNENTPLPGRPAKPARLCACAQEKGWGFPRKQARLFFGKSPAFLFARELSCRHQKLRAHIVYFSKRRSIAKNRSRTRRVLVQGFGG